MKYQLLRAVVLIILAYSSRAVAQDFNRVYFNGEWQITNRDNATYYRDAALDDSLMSYDAAVIDRYYANDTIEMTGAYHNGKKHGTFMFFFPNGRPKMKINFAGNERNGVWEEFYGNGVLRIRLEYKSGHELVLALNDSLGKNLLSETVKVVQHQAADELIELEGNVVNNLRDGTWEVRRNGKRFATLKYKMGHLVKGSVEIGGIKSPVLNTNAFPLLADPAKFFQTESFEVEKGVLIRNNIVMEALHQYKYRTMQKVSLQTHEDLTDYIHAHFALRTRQSPAEIRITLNLKGGTIDTFSTAPALNKTANSDLKLLLDTITKLEFQSDGIVVVVFDPQLMTN